MIITLVLTCYLWESHAKQAQEPQGFLVSSRHDLATNSLARLRPRGVGQR